MLKKEVAVLLMRHLVEHNWHGYSQMSRWGDGEGTCDVTVGGKIYKVEQGDRDCSSAIISAYEAAGISCGGATYTGNMRQRMCATGNFRWHPMSSGYTAKASDVYLNEVNHTAMCLSDVPDMLMEFSISETGGIDGAEGDQTGRESRIGAYYDYPWNGILECVNTESADRIAETPVTVITNTGNLPVPQYRAYTIEDGWLEWMHGLVCEDGCGDDFAGVRGHLIRNLQVKNLGPNGWFRLNMKRQGELARNVENKDMSDYVIGVTIYYDTPEPGKTGYYEAKYRVSPLGNDYLKWEYDNKDGGAGNDRDGIDRIQLTVEKAA